MTRLKPQVKSIDPLKLIETMMSNIRPSHSVLEIGPGVRPFELTFTPLLRVFVEPSSEYVALLQKQISQSSGKIIIRMDALSFLKSLPDKSFELIVCLDVIEHLKKDLGLMLIQEMLRVSSNQVIVFTPLGYMPQHMPKLGIDTWGFGEVELQTHLSGWQPQDFPIEFELFVANDFHIQPDGESFGAILAIANLSVECDFSDNFKFLPLIMAPKTSLLERDPFLFQVFLPAIISGKEFLSFGKIVSGKQSTDTYFGVTASSSTVKKFKGRDFRMGKSNFLNTLKIFFCIFPLQISRREDIRAVGFNKIQRFMLAGFSFSKFDEYQLPPQMFIKTQIRLTKLITIMKVLAKKLRS